MRRPLTPKMVETLIDCHERELLNLEPYDVSIVPSARGLIIRGLVITRPHILKNGKRIIALFVSDEGLEVLKQL
jgi:hypothetical protein